MSIYKSRRLITLFLITGFIVSACGLGSPTTPTPEIPDPVTSTPEQTEATRTSSPSITPPVTTESVSIPEVILIAAADADPSLVNKLEASLSEFANSNGIRFGTLPSLESGSISPTTRLVVSTAPDPGLENQAAASPQVEFLAVLIPGIEASGNLSTVSSINSVNEQAGFLAGYLAALVTPEWRVGVLAPSDIPEGKSAEKGFMNGVFFFCGLCRQTYPPFYTYPLFAELPSTSSAGDWQAAAQALIDQSVKTIYLAPGADQPELLDYLGQTDVQVIGSSTPPPTLLDQWVASITQDIEPILESLLPKLLNRDGGIDIPVMLSIEHINEDIVTEGRFRLLKDLADDLGNGFVDPGAGPLDVDE